MMQDHDCSFDIYTELLEDEQPATPTKGKRQVEAQLYRARKEIESLQSKLLALNVENTKLKVNLEKFKGDLRKKDDSIQSLQDRLKHCEKHHSGHRINIEKNQDPPEKCSKETSKVSAHSGVISGVYSPFLRGQDEPKKKRRIETEVIVKYTNPKVGFPQNADNEVNNNRDLIPPRRHKDVTSGQPDTKLQDVKPLPTSSESTEATSWQDTLNGKSPKKKNSPPDSSTVVSASKGAGKEVIKRAFDGSSQNLQRGKDIKESTELAHFLEDTVSNDIQLTKITAGSEPLKAGDVKKKDTRVNNIVKREVKQQIHKQKIERNNLTRAEGFEIESGKNIASVQETSVAVDVSASSNKIDLSKKDRKATKGQVSGKANTNSASNDNRDKRKDPARCEGRSSPRVEESICEQIPIRHSKNDLGKASGDVVKKDALAKHGLDSSERGKEKSSNGKLVKQSVQEKHLSPLQPKNSKQEESKHDRSGKKELHKSKHDKNKVRSTIKTTYFDAAKGVWVTKQEKVTVKESPEGRHSASREDVKISKSPQSSNRKSSSGRADSSKRESSHSSSRDGHSSKKEEHRKGRSRSPHHPKPKEVSILSSKDLQSSDRVQARGEHPDPLKDPPKPDRRERSMRSQEPEENRASQRGPNLHDTLSPLQGAQKARSKAAIERPMKREHLSGSLVGKSHKPSSTSREQPCTEGILKRETDQTDHVHEIPKCTPDTESIVRIHSCDSREKEKIQSSSNKKHKNPEGVKSTDRHENRQSFSGSRKQSPQEADPSWKTSGSEGSPKLSGSREILDIRKPKSKSAKASAKKIFQDDNKHIGKHQTALQSAGKLQTDSYSDSASQQVCPMKTLPSLVNVPPTTSETVESTLSHHSKKPKSVAIETTASESVMGKTDMARMLSLLPSEYKKTNDKMDNVTSVVKDSRDSKQVKKQSDERSGHEKSGSTFLDPKSVSMVTDLCTSCDNNIQDSCKAAINKNSAAVLPMAVQEKPQPLSNELCGGKPVDKSKDSSVPEQTKVLRKKYVERIPTMSDTERLCAYIKHSERREQQIHVEKKQYLRREQRRLGAKRGVAAGEDLDGEHTYVYQQKMRPKVMSSQVEAMEVEGPAASFTADELEDLWNQGIDVTDTNALATYIEMQRVMGLIHQQRQESSQHPNEPSLQNVQKETDRCVHLEKQHSSNHSKEENLASRNELLRNHLDYNLTNKATKSGIVAEKDTRVEQVSKESEARSPKTTRDTNANTKSKTLGKSGALHETKESSANDQNRTKSFLKESSSSSNKTAAQKENSQISKSSVSVREEDEELNLHLSESDTDMDSAPKEESFVGSKESEKGAEQKKCSEVFEEDDGIGKDPIPLVSVETDYTVSQKSNSDKVSVIKLESDEDSDVDVDVGDSEYAIDITKVVVDIDAASVDSAWYESPVAVGNDADKTVVADPEKAQQNWDEVDHTLLSRGEDREPKTVRDESPVLNISTLATTELVNAGDSEKVVELCEGVKDATVLDRTTLCNIQVKSSDMSSVSSNINDNIKKKEISLPREDSDLSNDTDLPASDGLQSEESEDSVSCTSEIMTSDGEDVQTVQSDIEVAELSNSCSTASESGGSSLDCRSVSDDELDDLDLENDSFDKEALAESELLSSQPDGTTKDFSTSSPISSHSVASASSIQAQLEDEGIGQGDFLELHPTEDSDMFGEDSLAPPTPKKQITPKIKATSPGKITRQRTPIKTSRMSKEHKVPPKKKVSKSPAGPKMELKSKAAASCNAAAEEGEILSDEGEPIASPRRGPQSLHSTGASRKRTRSTSRERDDKRRRLDVPRRQPRESPRRSRALRHFDRPPREDRTRSSRPNHPHSYSSSAKDSRSSHRVYYDDSYEKSRSSSHIRKRR